MPRNFRNSRRNLRKFSGVVPGQIEQLETRSLLTGTVNVVLSASNSLTITGDDDNNAINIDISEDGVRVTTTGGTALKINGVLDGDSNVVFPLPAAPFKDVKIDMKGGNDTVNITVDNGSGSGLGTGAGSGAADPLAITGDLTVKLGDGNNSFNLDLIGDGGGNGAVALSVGGDVKITGGKGSDFVDLDFDDTEDQDGNTVFIGKGLTIDLGDGENGTDITTDSDFTVTGDVKYKGGKNGDVLTLHNQGTTKFLKSLSVDTGKGSGTLQQDAADDVSFHSDDDSSLAVTKDVTIKVGDGVESFVEIEDDKVTIGGKLDITTGSGKDEVFVGFGSGGGSSVGKDVDIDTGKGDDFVSVVTSDGTVVINGNLDIKLGDGNDCLEVGDSENLEAGLKGTASAAPNAAGVVDFDVKKSLKIEGGDGDDVIALADIRIGDDLEVKGDAGDDVMVGTGLRVADDVKITGDKGSDKGEDQIAVFGMVIGDKLTIDAGGNNDVVGVDGLTVGGKVDIKLGSGVDRLIIGTATIIGGGAAVKIDAETGTDGLFSDTSLAGASVKNFEFEIDEDDIDGLEEALFAALNECFSFDT